MVTIVAKDDNSLVITPELQTFASQIIHNAVKINRGILELKSKIEEKEAQSGTALQNLYGRCVAANAEKAVALFKGSCAFAESELVKEYWAIATKSDADAEKPKLSDLVGGSWASAKSVIINGAEKGLPVHDKAAFPTVSKVKTTLAEAKKTAEGGERAPRTASLSKLSDALTASLNAFIKECTALDTTGQDTVAGLLMELTHKVTELRGKPVSEKIADTDEAMALQNAAARREAAKRGGSRAAA